MKFILTKKDLFSFILFFILVCLLVFWPVLLAPYNVKYLSFLYFVIGIILLPILKIPYSFIKRTKVFFFLLIINFVALVVHFTDSKTVVNISALIFSYLALYLLVIGGVQYLGSKNFEETVFKYFLYILLISLIISPILTLLKWPYAPPYYPWEALFSSKRLLLVIGKNVGHSDSMWLMAFGAAFIMKNIFSLNQKKILNIVILLLLIWGLIETESRTALLFIIILSIALASYKSLFPRRLFVLVPVIGAFIFYFTIVKPDYQVELNKTITNIQNDFPSLRIATTYRNSTTVYAGRDILNLAMFSVFSNHPWFGAGDSDPIFMYGIDNQGNIAYGGDKLSASETMMRMLAKYGIFYFFVLILFIIFPLIRAFKGYYEDNVFVISVGSIILISGLNGTIFENLYSISGVFTILILYFLVLPPQHRSNQNAMALINN